MRLHSETYREALLTCRWIFFTLPKLIPRLSNSSVFHSTSPSTSKSASFRTRTTSWSTPESCR